MSLGATLTASFLVTFARPVTWPLALAAFLIRGGLLLVLAPIVVLPSAAGLANVVAPFLTSFVFGGVTATFLALVVGIGLASMVWLIAGGLLAAAAEAEMTWLIATDEEIRPAVDNATPRDAASAGDGRPGETPRRAWRILAVRLIAFGPLLIALIWGSARVVAVAYRELTVPSDVLTPVVLRVVRGAPEAVAVIIVAWLLGQIVGALAARRVVIGDERVTVALVRAAGRLVRHPIRVLALELVPLVALVAVLAPSAAAAAAAWEAIRAAFTNDSGALVTIGLVGLFVGLWAGGLVLLAAVSAWRSAAWTVEVAGTFGATASGREGY